MITYGENGWIFLTGGSNNVVDTYNGSYTYSNWHCDWLQLIKDRNFFCQEMGIRYIHLIAPEKLGVYTEMIKSLNIDFHQSPSMILSKANSEQLPIINPTIYLREQSKNYKVYHKTDSHWNFKGAYSAYQLLMRNLNLETNNDGYLFNFPTIFVVSIKGCGVREVCPTLFSASCPEVEIRLSKEDLPMQILCKFRICN